MNRAPGWRGFAEKILIEHVLAIPTADDADTVPTCSCGAPAALCGVRWAAREFEVPIPDAPELVASGYQRRAES